MPVNIEFQTQNQNRAARDILDIRDRVQSLSREQIALRRASQQATAEERRGIRTRQESLRIRTAELRSLQQDINLRKQRITQLIREQRQQDANVRREETALRRLARERQAAFDQATLAGESLFRVFSRLTGSLIESAASFETFRTSVNAIQGSAEAGSQRFDQLLDLTEELVGIDTGNLISFANRLDAVGLAADQTDAVLRGVVRSQGELGKVGAVNVRILTQLTQAISSNRISGQDFLPILREMPRFWMQASEALMTNVSSLEEFRTAADRFGGPANAIVTVLDHIGRTSQGINLSTFAAQIDILRDRSLRLAATLGSHVLPAFTRVISVASSGVQAIEGWSDTSQSILAWTIVVAAATTAVAALGRILGFVFGIERTHLIRAATFVWERFSALVSGTITSVRNYTGFYRELDAIIIKHTLSLRTLANVTRVVIAFQGLALATIEPVVRSIGVMIDLLTADLPGERLFISPQTIKRVRDFDVELSRTGRTLDLNNDRIQQTARNNAEYNRVAVQLVNQLQRADRLRDALIRATNVGANREEILGLRREIQFAIEGAGELRAELRDIYNEILRIERLPIRLELTSDEAIRAAQDFQDAISPSINLQSNVAELISNVDREYRRYGRAVNENYEAILDNLGDITDENRAEYLRISLERERELDQILRDAGTARQRIREEFNSLELREEEKQTQAILSYDQRRFRERIELIRRGRRQLFDAQRVPLDRAVFDAEGRLQDAITGGNPDEIIRARENLFRTLAALERADLDRNRFDVQARLEIADRFARRRVTIARQVQSTLRRIGQETFDERVQQAEDEATELERISRAARQRANREGRPQLQEQERIIELRLQNERDAAEQSFRTAVALNRRLDIVRANELQREVAIAQAIDRIRSAATPEDREAERLAAIAELDRLRSSLENALQPLDRERERSQQLQLDLFIKGLQQEERSYEQSLSRRTRFYRSFSRNLVSLGEDLVFNRGANFREIVTEFIASTARQIAQQKILELFLIDSDNRVTELKLANLRRIEAEQARIGGGTIPTSILARGGSSLGGNASTILSIISLISSVAGLFHNPVNDAFANLAGFDLARVLDRPVAAGERSTSDFVDRFVDGFQRGAATQPSGQQQPVVVNATINWNPLKDTPAIINQLNEAIDTNRGSLRTA